MGRDFICSKEEPIVETTAGKLRGFQYGTTYHFFGIRYAECKRWQQPTPVEPWEGVKDALSYGYIAYPGSPDTPMGDLLVPHRFWPKSEDCLNLNIWTQSITEGVKKPVMVWIHGGGYAAGSAIEIVAYDGRNLSEFGDIVFVSVNHRLNVLGYLDVSDYGEAYKNSGNCGNADLVAALQWIHDNIEAFGGDPDNVTIWGQSGGGGKVTNLMQTPAADGLFHKVIVESGIRRVSERKVEKSFSDAIVKGLLKKAATDNFQNLVKMPVTKLLACIEELGREGLDTRNWGPVVDGWLTGHALEDGFTPHGRTIPMLIGSNINEFGFLSPSDKYGYTEQEREQYVRDCFPGQDCDRLIELFRRTWPHKNLIDAVFLDDGYRPAILEFMNLRARTGCAPTYNYVFALEFPFDGGKSAWHCSEIPFTFRNTDKVPICSKPGVTGILEEQMSAAWVRFAYSGDPNHDGLPEEWPQWSEDNKATMVFDETSQVRIDFDRELCACHNSMKYVPVVPEMNF